LLNLNFAVAVNQPPSEDAMHRLIERADAEKFRQGERTDRQAPTSPRFDKAIDMSRLVDRMPRTPVLLTPNEVAELLRTSRKAIYTMIERAQLPGIVRIGRRVLVREDALVDRLRQKSTPSLESR
jgi:excisionase family DNA binding protein